MKPQDRSGRTREWLKGLMEDVAPPRWIVPHRRPPVTPTEAVPIDVVGVTVRATSTDGRTIIYDYPRVEVQRSRGDLADVSLDTEDDMEEIGATAYRVSREEWLRLAVVGRLLPHEPDGATHVAYVTEAGATPPQLRRATTEGTVERVAERLYAQHQTESGRDPQWFVWAHVGSYREKWMARAREVVAIIEEDTRA
jgi:hypothetical protein